MDKELIDTAHEIWAAAQLCPGEGVEDGAQRVAEILSRIDAERGKGAVAWALFSENGNIRIWTSASLEVKKLAEEQGLSLSPLYAAPQPPAPCPICANRDWYGIDALQAKVAEQSAEIERLTQKNAELREKLHDESAQHVQFMLHDHPKALAARDATIAQQAERIAELEKVAKAYEDQVAAHNKTLDEVARLSAMIEKCEKALASAVEWGVPMRDAPKSSRPYWFDDSVTALAAIAAHKKGGAE